MRLLPVLGLSLVLLASASMPAIADQGGDDRGKAPERSGDRRGPTSIGAFDLTQGERNVSGSFVSFSYSNAGVHGFTVAGTRVYDILVSPPGTGRLAIESSGAQVRVRAPGYALQVHDNPAAVTQIEARDDGNVTLVLAAGATLVRTSEDAVRFTIGNLTGRARGDDLTIRGNSVTVEGKLLVFVESPRGKFDVKRSDIGQAIGKGHVGAEGSFDRHATGVAEDVVSFGNVTMRTVRAEHGNVTVEVEGHGTQGRVLVLNIDRALLGAEHAGKLHITLDNETVAVENDLATLLDPEADGIKPVYHIVFDPASDAFQVLVRVPHYSVHTLSVTTLLDTVPPSVLIGVVAGVALLVPSALVLFRKK